MSKRGARFAAKQVGASSYITGKPCSRGHLAARETYSGQCTECRRLLEKKRYAANPAKHIAQSRKFRVGKEKLLAEKATIARANETSEQRKARLEKAKLKQREWRLLNPAHVGAKQSKKAYKESNPGKVVADTVKRRLGKLQRTPKWVGSEEQWLIREAYELAALRTKMFGFSWHVDHKIPLQGKLVSGLHVPENLQVIPGVLNVKKANKYCPVNEKKVMPA